MLQVDPPSALVESHSRNARVLGSKPSRDQHLLDAHRFDPVYELLPVYSVSIAKRVLWSRIPRKSFHSLSADPNRRWRIRHVEVNDPSTLVRQNEENEEHAERRRGYGNADGILRRDSHGDTQN